MSKTANINCLVLDSPVCSQHVVIRADSIVGSTGGSVLVSLGLVAIFTNCGGSNQNVLIGFFKHDYFLPSRRLSRTV
jgi:hypothetical protein